MSHLVDILGIFIPEWMFALKFQIYLYYWCVSRVSYIHKCMLNSPGRKLKNPNFVYINKIYTSNLQNTVWTTPTANHSSQSRVLEQEMNSEKFDLICPLIVIASSNQMSCLYHANNFEQCYFILLENLANIILTF